MRKRAIYYTLVPQGFNSTDMIDEYIGYACQILGCSRSALGIEASPKALIAGAGLTSASTVDYMQLPSCFVNVSDPSQMIDFYQLRVVLVVEKETIF